MPDGLQSNIKAKLHSHPEFGQTFTAEQVLQVLKILRFCFNFRPDLGYRPGMEFLVLTLITSFFSKKNASRVLLDFSFSLPLIRAVFSGNLFIMKKYTGKLKDGLLQRIPHWGKYVRRLEIIFFRLCTSFFGKVLSLKSLRKFIDLVVLFGDELFLKLFFEILVQISPSEINDDIDENVIKEFLGPVQQKIILDNLRKTMLKNHKETKHLGYYVK